MKNKIYLIILALTLPFFGWGQNLVQEGDEDGDRGYTYYNKVIKQGAIPMPLPLNPTLPKPNTNYDAYIARDTIRLLPGFNSSHIKGKEFLGRIDETMIFPVDYQNPINPSEKELDITKPVGAIAGVADVSPTGAATYQIPIFTPPGTAGMQPQISIVYNSQGGNGLLGLGWDIAGLSAVTRTGQTVYYDGDVTPIRLSNDDRYLLDGNRLICTDGTYGNTNSTYATEIETFSRITALHVGGNRYFKVETKDGMTLEYGYTVNSRIMLCSNVLMWRLNKIKDSNENYMTYTYNQENGESWIEKIEYTRNTSVNEPAYATITFLYSEREDVQEGYVAGCKMTSTKLLRGIKVESDGQVLRRYWFKYAKIGFYSQLNEIIEEGSDGESCNSTVFAYDIVSTISFHNEKIIEMDESGFKDETIVAFGDFNGDGKEDFITITKDNLSWKVYFATDNGYTSPVNVNENNSFNYAELKGIRAFVSKPDDRGRPHIFVELRYKYKKNVVDNSCGLNISESDRCNKFIFKEYVFNNTSSPTKVGEFETIYEIPDDFSTNFPHIKTGNVYGDGTIHYIQTNGYSSKNNLFSLKIENTSLQSFEWGDVYDFHFYDFDGDGADELLVINRNSINVYKFIKGTSVPQLKYNIIHNYSAYYSSIRFGDFNGDGKTDFILHNHNSIGYLTFYFSTGKGFTEKCQLYINGFGITNFYIGDMNGDGKDDLIHVHSNSVDVYYSYGDGTFKKETFSINTNINLYNLPIFTSHYRGNGKASLMINASKSYTSNGKPFIFEVHFSKHPLNNRIRTIKDGLSNRTDFTYELLTKGGTFYTKETATPAGAGVMNFQGALYAVKQMTQPDAVSGRTIVNFSYTGAKIHRLGKGFLGFSEVTIDNVSTGIKTINTYGYHPSYFNVFLKETNILAANSNFSTVKYENDTHHYGNKRIFPFITQAKTTDHLTGFITTETFAKSDYDFVNGNLKKKKTEYGDVFTETTDYIYGSFGGNLGLQNRITEQKITTKHTDDGNATYTRIVNFDYDSNGNLKTETTDTGIATSYSNFNAFGQPKTVTVTASGPGASSYTKTLNYESKGRYIASVTDPLGTTSQKYDAAGNLQYEIDITGQKTSYKYDGFGRLTGTKTPEGHIITTKYKWDPCVPNGNRYYTYIETKAPGRPTTITYFDRLGRTTRSKTEGSDGRMVVTDTEYNTKGQIEQTSFPYFDGETPQYTENKYDEYGRIKEVIVKLTTPHLTTK